AQAAGLDGRDRRAPPAAGLAEGLVPRARAAPRQAGLTVQTLNIREEGPVVFAEISAPPMNLLGPELVRDLVSLIQRAEGDTAVRVLVFSSANPDYFISHVDLKRVADYREEAAKLTGEA